MKMPQHFACRSFCSLAVLLTGAKIRCKAGKEQGAIGGIGVTACAELAGGKADISGHPLDLPDRTGHDCG